MESSGRDGREHEHGESERSADGTTHAADRTDHGAGSGLPATAVEPSSERRMRSRSPHRNEGFLVMPEGLVGGLTHGLSDFVSYVDNLNVVELELNLAPRDVHKEKGCWVVNAKAKKNAEVCMRKLNHEDQELFQQAMKKEVDSFLSADAVQICSSHGIPPERIMQMRWVLTRKPISENDGTVSGRKPKARLIIKGFQDPRLMDLPREAPTLSCLGRNLILANAARSRTSLCSGDIRTAFLQGHASEMQDELYGMPPQEVKDILKMKDTDILRIVKAIYGLLMLLRSGMNL